MSIRIGLGIPLQTSGVSAPSITLTASPVIAQSNTDPQGNATVSSSATSDDAGFAIVSSEWVHSVLGDVQSNTSPYTKPAGAAYTLRLKQVVSATDLPNKTVWSNTLTVDALSITAVIEPAIGSLEDGNTLENNVTNWDEFDDILNYASNGGSISSATIAFTGTGPVDATTVLDAGDTAGFTVTVTDSNSNETDFAVAPVTVAAKVPAQVTGLTATGGDTQVALSWSAPDDGGSSLTGYHVERNINGAGWTTLLASHGTTSYTNTGLTNDTPHQYRVSAINAIGTGSASSVASATPSAADVTAPTMESLTFGAQSGGDAPITIAGLSEDCTAYWVLTSTDQSGSATAAQVKAGTATDTEDSGSFSATVGGGPYSEALTSGLSGSHYLLVALEDAEPNLQSTVYADGPQTIDTTAPVLVPASCTPADGATSVAVDSNITLIFDKTVVANTGNFYIYEDGVLSETIAVGSATIGTTDVVLNPVSDFTNDVDVSVRWDANVVEDAQSNGVAANATDTLINFQSVAGGSAFDDDFSSYSEDDAIATVSANWTAATASMVVNANAEAEGTGASPAPHRYTGTLTADHYAEVTFVNASVSGVTKVFTRYTDDNNHYELRARNTGAVELREKTSGSFTQVVNVNSVNVTTGDVLRIEWVGTAYDIKVNGSSIASGTDSSHTTPTVVGFSSSLGDPITKFSCWDI